MKGVAYPCQVFVHAKTLVSSTLGGHKKVMFVNTLKLPRNGLHFVKCRFWRHFNILLTIRSETKVELYASILFYCGAFILLDIGKQKQQESVFHE